VFSLYTRWFHRRALLVGWLVAMVYGTWRAWEIANPVSGVKHFGGSLDIIPAIGQLGYIALTAFALNVIVAVVLTVVLNALKVSNGRDETIAFDYVADADDPRVARVDRSS
jgi:SSS family solute:Na+ symporter